MHYYADRADVVPTIHFAKKNTTVCGVKVCTGLLSNCLVFLALKLPHCLTEIFPGLLLCPLAGVDAVDDASR